MSTRKHTRTPTPTLCKVCSATYLKGKLDPNKTTCFRSDLTFPPLLRSQTRL